MGMKRDFEFIQFVLKEEKPKTTSWRCVTRKSGDELGMVEWYPPWRHYCYFPTVNAQTVLSSGCLADIREFISQLEFVRKL